jgi:quercetin dioxygenase-like cupin family protein
LFRLVQVSGSHELCFSIRARLASAIMDAGRDYIWRTLMQDSQRLKSGDRTRLPKVLKPGEGEVHRLLGEPRIFKVMPAENGGACLQFETSHAPGTHIPVHAHLHEDEAFYILGGQFDFLVGNGCSLATAGSFLFVPRGIFRGFTALGPAIGRMLVTVTFGTGHEGFFRETLQLAQKLNETPSKQVLFGLSLKYGWVWPEGVNASV